MYARIMMTTDGSQLARLAIPEVQRLSGPGTEVLLVQVVDTVGRIVAQTTPAGFDLERVGGFGVEAVEQVVSGQQRAAQAHLDEAKAALQAAGVADVSTRILEGLPGPTIVEAAEEAGCDVIVMVTHGRAGVVRTVMGSVADYVVRHVGQTPVLLVRPGGLEQSPQSAGEKDAAASS